MSKVREIVINTGPLIALSAALGDLQILDRLFDRVVVPFEVCQEILSNNATRFGASEFDEAIWLEKKRDPVKLIPLLQNTIDLGEASVIQSALDESISTVCIDETVGRRIARLSGLEVTGSLGILIQGKQESLPIDLSLAVKRMRDKGIWISKNLEVFILNQ